MNKIDCCGKLFENEITNSNFSTINTGHYTYYNLQHHSFTAIDLTILSQDYLNRTHFEILSDNAKLEIKITIEHFWGNLGKLI